MRGTKVKALRARVIADLGAGKWREMRMMPNGQMINLGLGGVFRKVKKAMSRRG